MRAYYHEMVNIFIYRVEKPDPLRKCKKTKHFPHFVVYFQTTKLKIHFSSLAHALPSGNEHSTSVATAASAEIRNHIIGL